MILGVILVCGLLLVLLYLYLERRDKKVLTKLQEGYDENSDKSRRIGEAPARVSFAGGNREVPDNSTKREPVVKGDGKPKTGRVLPTTDSITPSEDKRELGNTSEEGKVEL